MPFDNFNQPTDRPEPYEDTPFSNASYYLEGLAPFNLYRPLYDRLRELNARFMSNERETTSEDG